MKKSKIIPLIAISKIQQWIVKTTQTTLNIVKSIYYKLEQGVWGVGQGVVGWQEVFVKTITI